MDTDIKRRLEVNFLTPVKTAEILHTTPGVLAVWRSNKRYGLRYVKLGSKVFYRLEDIEKFIEARTFSGTGEETPRPSRRRRAA